MILLSKDIKSLEIEADLCVRHKTYPRPQCDGRHVTYEEFAADHKSLLKNVHVMAVVGINKLITPANRTKVGPLLLRPIDGVQRVSIDRSLFVAEPWRAWWHFGCTGAKYGKYTYSYTAESHWKGAQDGMRDDPFTADEIIRFGRGKAASDYQEYFSLDIKRIEVGADIQRDYQSLRTRCFDEEHTVNGVMKRLTEFAQSVCPQRSIPNTTKMFEHDSVQVIQTDLKVDDYLTRQVRSLVSITNSVARGFYHGNG